MFIKITEMMLFEKRKFDISLSLRQVEALKLLTENK